MSGTDALRALLDTDFRTTKPLSHGLTLALDRGELGPAGISDVAATASAFIDAKLGCIVAGAIAGRRQRRSMYD
jgi:hypothetical protein